MRQNRGQSPISITLVNGFPIADWRAVRERIDALPAAQRSDAWLESERARLLHFPEALGSAFRLEESDSAMLVSSLERRAARTTVEFMERTLERIGIVLEGIA